MGRFSDDDNGINYLEELELQKILEKSNEMILNGLNNMGSVIYTCILQINYLAEKVEELQKEVNTLKEESLIRNNDCL